MSASARVMVGPHSHALVVMAKAPVRGAVKSRLVPPLTEEEAAALNRCFIRDVCGAIETAAATVAASSNARVIGMIAYTPAGAQAAFDGLVPASFKFIEQNGEGLGARLIHVASALLEAGFESVALMNSDSPTIPAALLTEAITGLARPGNRVALIGADDGGYCLIGLKGPHWRLFEDIAWSTDAVLAQTLQRAAKLRLEVLQSPSWYDVDEANSLRRLISELSGERAPDKNRISPRQANSSAALATRTWLDEALANGLAARLGITASGVRSPR